MDKVLISQRKTPQQERSKTIFESILEAAAHILSTVGVDKSTTNKIAEMAGVSIGSLYQYFPNKEALVSAILERQFKKHAKLIEEKILTLRKQPNTGLKPEEMVDLLVRTIMETTTKNRKLLRAIGSYTFSLGHLNTIVEGRKHMEKHIRALIVEHLDRTKVSNPEISTYVIINAVAGVIEAIVFDDITEEFQSKLIDETVLLIQNHITPSSIN
jgi:AcrR family transcriptional regulator